MADMLIGIYGTGMLLWGINQNYDNDGGFWHNAFYRYTYAARFAPIATLYQAFQIRNSYALTAEQFAQDESRYAATYTDGSDTLYSLVYRYNPYLYNPSETDEDAVSYLDETDFTRQAYLAVACLVSAAIHFVTFEGIQSEFLVKRADYLAREEELESLAEFLEKDDEEEN
jgi:hypothetical protein